MGQYTKIQRTLRRVAAILSGVAVIGLAVLVLYRIAVHTTPAEAASIIYYPNFCLGGWKYPQHASGPAAVTGSAFDAAAFTADNSAYLESSTASQMFCGYFSVKNAKNPPKKAVISFNWNFAFPDAAGAASTSESFTSPEGYISVPAAGVMVPVASTTASSTFPMNPPVGSLPASPQTVPGTSPAVVPPSKSSASSETTEIPLIPNTAAANDAISQPTPAPSISSPSDPNTTSQPAPSDSAPVPTPPTTPAAEQNSSSVPATPAPVPSTPDASTPPTEPAPAPTPASDAPQSLNLSVFIASLIAEKVQAAEPTDPDTIVQSPLSADAFKDFLEVSYSLDGIRWTAIGRVNKENWKGYKVEIPVTSWDEVKRLQIMISVLPTIDEKPDIYLDSMSMRAEYNQTVAELAAQGLAAMSNAVDALIGDGNDAEGSYDIVPDAPKAPQGFEKRTKKLQFSVVGSARTVQHDTFDGEGRVSGKVASKKISLGKASGSPSLLVSGECSKKYFVILTYRNEDDYVKKPRSFVVNQAHECDGGHFTFDLAGLSTDTNPGSQYLVVGEQGEEGTWNVVSDVFPIAIEASTTVEIIYQ